MSNPESSSSQKTKWLTGSGLAAAGGFVLLNLVWSGIRKGSFEGLASQSSQPSVNHTAPVVPSDPNTDQDRGN